MKLIKEPALRVEADLYTLEFLPDRPAVRVTDQRGDVVGDLFLVSSCHAREGYDVTSSLSAWKAEEKAEEILLTAEADSLVWKRKQITLRLMKDRIIYGMSVEGEGTLTETELLSGLYTGSNRRHSSARVYSGFQGETLFNPEPDGHETYHRPLNERSLIDMTGVPIP